MGGALAEGGEQLGVPGLGRAVEVPPVGGQDVVEAPLHPGPAERAAAGLAGASPDAELLVAGEGAEEARGARRAGGAHELAAGAVVVAVGLEVGEEPVDERAVGGLACSPLEGAGWGQHRHPASSLGPNRSQLVAGIGMA